MKNYQPQIIEKKWQKQWERWGLYQVKDQVRGKKNFYHLVMFVYPSGDLHIGHWYNFAPADVLARYKMMKGFNVLSPIGFDAFGLPAENAAIKKGITPWDWTYQNIRKMRQQLKSIGAIYDWSREIITSDPEYYKWTQWMFLQLYKKGLAYRQKAPANWCPSCQTVLANEQVVDGCCERCDSTVVQKEIEQWLFKITAYAERLLKGLDKLDWPEKTKTTQRNWIGRSEGAEIRFALAGLPAVINVFTTRPDTLFGATYLVLAPEHELIRQLKPRIANGPEVEKYIEISRKKSELERKMADHQGKTGVELKGVKAINPVNQEQIPVWVSDYVLMGYGAGAIMAVPAHDQRDFEFAQKFNLPIKMVICPNYPAPVCPILTEAFGNDGHLVASGQFSGMPNQKAKGVILKWLVEKKLAKPRVHYKLRDWLISRQRYWGAPIPIIYCPKCGEVAVPEKDLPVRLPKNVDFRPTGESPLARVENFVEIKCPRCRGQARRETDTMDTFVCSSWYFLRYMDPRNNKRFAALDKIKKWLPVDIYIGGAEHSISHLLFSRFLIKALKDLNYLNFEEPFSVLRHQGIILGSDGQKMSKSRGNVVSPDELVRLYGSDAARTYFCFMGPYDQGGSWNPQGITGVQRFLRRIWNLVIMLKDQVAAKRAAEKNIDKRDAEKLLHQTIKKVTSDLEGLKFNTAIAALMTLLNVLEKSAGQVSLKMAEILVKLTAPFAPHLAEELWQELGHKKSVFLEKWPIYRAHMIRRETFSLPIQVNGKVRDQIEVAADLPELEIKKLVLERDKIKKWLADRPIKKFIFIPDKLINLLV